MGRERKAGNGAGPGGHAKDRHKKTAREVDWSAPAPPGLKAHLDVPLKKSKHKSYYEFVDNKDKKKKLEYEVGCLGSCSDFSISQSFISCCLTPPQVTQDKEPPPGFEFVPIGNPELTTACKELSREQDAMIFIVSVSTTLCLSFDRQAAALLIVSSKLTVP